MMVMPCRLRDIFCLFDMGGRIRSRILNPNILYHTDAVDEYKSAKLRFVSGSSYCDKKSKVGQAYGHMVRVIDCANTDSEQWLDADLTYVVIELLRAS